MLDSWSLYRMRGVMLQKLTSRKLWAAVVAASLAVFSQQLGIQDVELVKLGIQALVTFILGESVVDAARVFRAGGK